MAFAKCSVNIFFALCALSWDERAALNGAKIQFTKTYFKVLFKVNMMIVKKIFSFLSPVCPFLSTLKIFLSAKGKDKDFLKRCSELNTLNYDTYGYYLGLYETSFEQTLSTILKQKAAKGAFYFGSTF